MYKFLILLFSLGLISPLFGSRSVRAIFLKAPRDAPQGAFLQIGTKAIEVELPRRYLSPEAALPKGDLSIAILPNALAEGEEIPVESQKIKIPQDWTRCILVFLPTPENTFFPANVIAINASDNHFPLGSKMVFNLTKSRFIGKFESKTLRVKPMGSGVLKDPIRKRGAYNVMIDCVLPEDKKRIAVVRTKWVHSPDDRQILFVVPQEGRKVPRIFGIPDRPKKEETN